jgi:CheY-like chemotaxis protein
MVAKNRVFCPACGLQVEPALGMEGDVRTVSCSLCDLVLESKPAPGASTAVQAVGTAAAKLETVMAAEDTEGIRKMLVRLLGERGIAHNVVASPNGEELLVEHHRLLAAGKSAQLVILDVNMPILNGINTAIAIRAAERAYGSTPVPILFFTSQLCDETFKRVLQFTAPAKYLNKGAEGPPEQFAERLVQVLQRLLNPQPGAAPV